MFTASMYSGIRNDDYPLIIEQARHLFDDDLPLMTNLANISALLGSYLDRCNWVGFYVWNQARGELILGPFQGKVACTRIPPGKGVCGTAFAQKTSQLVPDVHAFPGHIACDSASRSELVIPVIHRDSILGVLDLDSPELGRFDHIDRQWLEALSAMIAPRWAMLTD